MLEAWQDGRIKLHVTRAGLRLRRDMAPLFANGDYQGITARGRFERNVISFLRQHGGDQVLVVAGEPRTSVTSSLLCPSRICRSASSEIS